jgi:hypothetical protein
MIVTNEVTGQEIDLSKIPFEILKNYVLDKLDEQDILEYFDAVDFQRDLINQLIDRINEKESENLRLKKEVNRLLRKLNMCDLTF